MLVIFSQVEHQYEWSTENDQPSGLLYFSIVTNTEPVLVSPSELPQVFKQVIFIS